MTHQKHRIGAESSKGKIAGLYDLEETIGKGHYAVVKLARHVFTGERVAVKVIDKSKLDKVSRGHLYQEVRCMKLVQHPHVVRLYEVIDTQTKLYLILELGDGGDMYDYIMKHRNGLPEDQAQKYFIQILEAISYCHKLHVVHRDLKPENVVFFEKLGIVKLTDFGFSNLFHPGEKLDTSCGSLAYSAPEILLGDSYEAPAVDIWSLGVILYMLVAGDPPFQEANDSETLTMILDCKYKKPSHLSAECLDLISKMLVREPAKRACLSEILSHVWLRWPKGKSAQGSTPDSMSSPGDSTNVGCCPLHLNSSIAAAQNPVELLSEKERMSIIQKMINGKIATKDEIIDAISKNNYNHITATYYLLAERKLRKEREHANRGDHNSSGSTTPRGHSGGGKTSHGASPIHTPIRGNSPARGLGSGLGSPGTFSKDLRGTLGLSPGRREDSGGTSSNAPVATTAPSTGRCIPLSTPTPRSAMETLVSPPGALPAHPNAASRMAGGFPAHPGAPGEIRKVFGPRPLVGIGGEATTVSGRFQLSSCTEEATAPLHPSSHVERPLRREIHAVKSSPQLLNDVIEEGNTPTVISGLQKMFISSVYVELEQQESATPSTAPVDKTTPFF